MKPLVIYHANCSDGSSAATCAYQYFGLEAEYYPATHGVSFDCTKVKDREIYFLDFCYPAEIMKEIKKLAWTLTILDHHKTAEEALRGLSFTGKFDMNKSGARLAFDYFVAYTDGTVQQKDKQLEQYINWVQDRDLWQYKLENTKEINDYLFSLPAFTIETADLWLDTLTSMNPSEAISLGAAINKYKTKQFHLSIERAFKVKMFDYEVWATNEANIVSEVAGELAKRGAFGVCFFINEAGKYVYSLRSRGENAIDVSELALTVGGGGHKNAAGCSSIMPLHEKI